LSFDISISSRFGMLYEENSGNPDERSNIFGTYIQEKDYFDGMFHA
jgi:hypothetical protein